MWEEIERIMDLEGDFNITKKQISFEKNIAHIPLRRHSTPEDIGRAVVFFASCYAKNITGQTLNVDGGSLMM